MTETKINADSSSNMNFLTKERVGFLLTKFPNYLDWINKEIKKRDTAINPREYDIAYEQWLDGRDRLIETFFDDFDKLSLHVFIQKYGIKTDVNDFVNLRYVKDWLVCRLVETRGD